MVRRIVALAGLAALAFLAAFGSTEEQSLAAGVENSSFSGTRVPDSTTDGVLLESSFPSSALGLAPPFRIYLPPGYDASTDRYPVLYLLHGNAIDSDFSEWSRKMKIDFTAGSLIAQGKIRPMIIVMPYGLHSYFMNLPGGLRWADYVTQDLVPFIDANFRTIPDREHRAIGGNSMGATGALHLAFNHTDLFSIVGAHSPALRTAPDEVITDWDSYAAYDPLRLVDKVPNLQTLQIWLDDGNEDPWRGNANEMHEKLAAKGINHTWNLLPGPHDTPYWVSHIPDYLQFYSTAFQHRVAAPAPAAAPSRPPAATAGPVGAPLQELDAPHPAEFRLGFAALAAQAPEAVGIPLEAEHYNPNGDSLQKTTTGLMVWRKADNWTAFTDGFRSWINGPFGLQERGNDERFDWEEDLP